MENKINMIGIGISTYNDYISTDNILRSIIKKTNAIHGRDYSIIVLDDGTTDKKIVKELKNVCDKHGVRLMKNSKNRGIPYTWNRITRNCGSEIVVIFNNDIIVANPDWLKYFEYFITRNEKIGAVGFPLINPPDFHMHNNDVCNITWDSSIESRWGDRPGHVGAAVGCCFGFKKSLWEQVRNPDDSTGFWEDLISFHEETHFGFRLSEMGYYNCMLHWPPMVHYGGQTFAKNAELIERSIDWSKWNKQEYIDTIKRSSIYPESWKIDRIAWKNAQGIETVDRMAFSRYMFAKYWNVLDSYDMPQVPVHRRVVDPIPKRKIKFLSKNMEEREAEI